MPGGMLRVVPPFRLPWSIIQQDVDRITGLGAELKLNHPITISPEELLGQGFDAVLHRQRLPARCVHFTSRESRGRV